MQKKYILFLVYFIGLLSNQMWAQYSLQGVVTDSFSQKNITDAAIHIEGSFIGVISDRQARFSIESPVPKFTIVVSHLGYHSYRKEVDLTKSNAFLEVALRAKPIEFKAVDISSSKVELAHDAPKYWVVDYEVMQDRLVLLLSGGSKTVLRLSDFNSVVIDEVPLGNFEFNYGSEHFRNNRSLRMHYLNEARNVYKDFNGNIHLFGGATVNEVLIENDSLRFFDQAPFSVFENTVLPIALSYDGCLYRQNVTKHNQLIRYTRLDTASKNITQIEIYDEAGARNAQVWWGRSFYAHPYNLIEVGEIDVKQLHDARLMREATGVYRELVSKAEYAPLFEVNDTLYLFDHVNGRFLTMDAQLEIKKERDIYYHHDKQWQDKMQLDPISGKVYLEFMVDGFKVLREFNLQTGKIIKVHVLEEQTFPEKIRVFDGYAYYMYKAKGDSQKRYLYKQLLD